jgi:hypothetical protein
LVNARKKPKKKKHDNKYSYNVRYYFTSAKITLLNNNAPLLADQNGSSTGNGLISKKNGGRSLANGSSIAVS